MSLCVSAGVDFPTTGVVLLLSVLAAVLPCAARAQVDDAQLQQARTRFEAGEQAYAAQDWPTALDAFTEAHRLMEGHPNQGMILFNIGRVHEELGHPGEAREAYRRFLAEAPQDAPNRNVAVERIAILDAQGDRDAPAPSPPADAATGTETSPPPRVETRSEGHWANWIIAGALVAVAAPAIAVPSWTLATEGECVESDANGCIERVAFGAIDGVGLGLGIAALIGAVAFAAGQPIQTQVQVSDRGAYLGVAGAF